MAERAGSQDRARVGVALISTVFTAGFAFVCSRRAESGGGSAAILDGLNLALFVGFSWWCRDQAMWKMLSAAVAFGLTELLADFLCVRCTGTLDYSTARSAMIWESPWWMPLSWAVVAVQVGVGGDAAIQRFGVVRGALLTGLLGAILIPFYERMAWGANWWRYRNCLLVGHAPVYIVVAEAIIGVGLAILGHLVLRIGSLRAAFPFGAAAGMVTIFGGVVGWGMVEFICRHARPAWPLH